MPINRSVKSASKWQSTKNEDPAPYNRFVETPTEDKTSPDYTDCM